jgi:3',5'-cyclic AMP phosphodiesterase CpdA
MGSQKWLWPNVKKAFTDDLRELFDRAGPWDLVLFTGDLAQSGTRHDYQELEGLLDKLWEEFAALGCRPTLIAIPGNHDVKWPDPLKPEAIALRSGWWSNANLRDAFWNVDRRP